MSDDLKNALWFTTTIVAIAGWLGVLFVSLMWNASAQQFRKQAIDHKAAAIDTAGNFYWIEQPTKASQP